MYIGVKNPNTTQYLATVCEYKIHSIKIKLSVCFFVISQPYAKAVALIFHVLFIFSPGILEIYNLRTWH